YPYFSFHIICPPPSSPYPLSLHDALPICHRLNRFGDRHLNNAFDTIARTRMRHHEPTQAYVKTQYEAKKNYREIKRKLKRYLVKSFFVVYGFLAILRVFQAAMAAGSVAFTSLVSVSESGSVPASWAADRAPRLM